MAKIRIAAAVACLILIAPGLALAQWPRTQRSTTATSPTGNTSPTGRAGRGACAQQAGLSQSIMQQRRQIIESARAQEEAVCSNSSLSMQQKHAQIEQIQQQARQRADALITPQQMQALRACRGGGRGGRGRAAGAMHHGGGGGGPCGEMPTASGKSFQEPTESGVEQ